MPSRKPTARSLASPDRMQAPPAPPAAPAADRSRRLALVPPGHPTGTAGEGAETDGTSRRLGASLLGYMLGVTLIITLLPFHFAVPERFRVMLSGDVVDVVANVLLFVPLGFLFRLTGPARADRGPVRALMLGLLLSAGIEAAQLLEASRYSSPIDVATNGAGAWLGAVLHDRLRRRLALTAGAVGRLSLEMPLMGLVYLLVPLLWIDSLASLGEPSRAPLPVLLALVGGILLAEIQRHHFGPTRGVREWQTGLAASGWFLLGAFPAIPGRPAAVLATSAALGAFVALTASRRPSIGSANRRFEVDALRAVAPVYAGYLLLLPLSPFEGSIAWSHALGFPGFGTSWGKPEVLRLLEAVAAFTLVGYVVAEFRGRSETPLAADLRRVVGWALAAAAVGELVSGFRQGDAASLARLVLLAGSATYGAWLYHLQRAHVRALLASAAPAEGPPGPA